MGFRLHSDMWEAFTFKRLRRTGRLQSGAAHDLPLLCASAFSATCSGHAALVVVQLPSLQLVFQDTVEAQCLPPYQAGFLGLRHCPTFIRLLERAAQSVYCPQVGLLTFCATPNHRS